MKTKFALLFALAIASCSHAANIVLFSTGLDAAGLPLAGGSADPHYDVLIAGNPDARVLSSPHPAYIPNSAASQWIWETADSVPGSVTRTFRTTFDLTGMDPLSAVINGRWSTDNQGNDILVNGVSTGQTSPTFLSFSNFSIAAANLLPGLNTIDFVAQDTGAPAAFRAEFLTATANLTSSQPGVPDSGSTLALMAGGLLLLTMGNRIFSRRQS